MSVLVEALSLVVPRINLDISYPGGVDAFLEAMCLPECPSRHVCADDKVVSVSFLSPDAAETVVSPLLDLGFIGLDEQRFRDFAFVDQHLGPTMPCDWIEWKRHRDGFTYAWLAGTEPGDMAAPSGWTPGHSRAMTRTDLRDEPGRMLKLAEEGEIETWLDFRTGEITVGLKRLAECASGAQPVSSRDNPGTEVALPRRLQGKAREDRDRGLLGVVVSALSERGLRTDRMDDDSVFGRLRTDRASYELFVTVNEAAETAAFFLLFPTLAPAPRRAAVAELCSRINYRLLLGSLEVDFSDGNVRFRCAVDVEDSALTPAMVSNIVSAGAWTLDEYHDRLVRVMIDDADPAAGFEETAE